MAITSRDQLINALGNNYSQGLVDKASIANAAAGQWHSLWRATGVPAQAAIPAAAAVCNNAMLGAIPFTQQTAPNTSYLGRVDVSNSLAATTLEFHDRLMHMGGLSGTLTTPQTVGIDLSANLAASNLAARLGAANYSNVIWWLEWFTDTGATGVNCTVNVTYNDAVSANLTVLALPATTRASRMFMLNGLVAVADGNRGGIRSVNTVQLAATTGTAGNFGVTATYPLNTIYKPLAGVRWVAQWADLGLEQVHNGACIMMIQVAGGTATGLVRANLKIIHG